MDGCEMSGGGFVSYCMCVWMPVGMYTVCGCLWGCILYVCVDACGDVL